MRGSGSRRQLAGRVPRIPPARASRPSHRNRGHGAVGRARGRPDREQERRRSIIPPSVHTFAREWRTARRRNEADLAGLVASSEFPSPLRRRYAAGPAFGFRPSAPDGASMSDLMTLFSLRSSAAAFASSTACSSRPRGKTNRTSEMISPMPNPITPPVMGSEMQSRNSP